MIRIWTKGTPLDLSHACERRSIPHVVVERYIPNFEWTIAQVEDLYRPKVVAWFAEVVDSRTGSGYPAGTLLHAHIEE